MSSKKVLSMVEAFDHLTPAELQKLALIGGPLLRAELLEWTARKIREALQAEQEKGNQADDTQSTTSTV